MERIIFISSILIAFLLLSLTSNAQTSATDVTAASASDTTAQKTQSFQSFLGNIDYIDVMRAGERYSYDITFNSPDGISKIESVEVTFTGDFMTETSFTVNFNGLPCKPERWVTPKSESNYYKMTFICSGNAKEIRDISRFRIDFSADQEAKNIIGTYKITYRNDWNLSSIIEKSVTRPSLSMFGTEYSIGDAGTIFLQLKDTNGFPVVNGSCYIDIYYPNTGNLSHPQWIYNSPMIYKDGSDGLFYYDLTVPNIQGIYMLSGTCNYEYLPVFLYPEDSINQSIINPIKGTYEGDTIVLNSREDGLYTRCTSAASPAPQQCIANYTFQLYDSVFESNISKIDIYYMGESTISSTLRMSIYNYSNGLFYLLPNSMTFSGLAVPANPSGLSDFLSNSLKQDGNNLSDFINDKKITIRLNTTGSTSFRNWNNWLTLRILTTEGVVSDVKGSGELHVSNLSSSVITSTASAIWNYPSRNLTDYNQTLMWNYLKEINQTGYNTISLINNVNSSIFFYLFQINGSISSKIDAINSNLNSINISLYNLITSMNSSLYSLVLNVNTSLSSQLYDIKGQLQNISGDLAQTILLIGDVNESLTNQLYSIQSDINGLSVQIDNVNASIFGKLYKIQDEITSVNNSILSSNATIMSKLDSLTSDIYALNASIIATLLILSNATLNISITQASLFNDLVALWGDSMAKTSYTAGFTGFLPFADAAVDDSQYTCLDNDTLQTSKNITLDTPDGIKNYIRTLQTKCTYGCRNNTCVAPDYTLFILLFIVAIVVYILYRHFFSET
jgi:hypothetical protein